MANTENEAARRSSKRAFNLLGVTVVLIPLVLTLLIVALGVPAEDFDVDELDKTKPWSYAIILSFGILLVYVLTTFGVLGFWQTPKHNRPSRVFFGALQFVGWWGFAGLLIATPWTTVTGVPALIAFLSAVVVSIDVARTHRAVEPQPFQDIQDALGASEPEPFQDIQDAVRHEPEYPQDASPTD